MLRHFPRDGNPLGRRVPEGAEDLEEGVPERLAHGAVQQEVEGRVDGEEGVCDLPHALYEVVLLHVAFSEEGGHDGVGSDADEEHEDDDDQHQGDAVPGRELLPFDPLLPQLIDDASVHEDQNEHRDDPAKRVLDPRVRDHERVICPQ